MWLCRIIRGFSNKQTTNISDFDFYRNRFIFMYLPLDSVGEALCFRAVRQLRSSVRPDISCYYDIP